MKSSSPLPGFVTFADLAEHVGITPNHLRVTLSEKGSPRPLVALCIGTKHLYNEFDAEDWAVKFEQWKAEAPQRRAAEREEAQRIRQAKLDAEAAEFRILRQIGETAQRTFDAEAAEIADMNRVGGPYRL